MQSAIDKIMINMEKEDILKLPLYQWTQNNPNNSTKNGVETCYHGEYHFEITGCHYYIDLRCYRGELVRDAFCRLFTFLVQTNFFTMTFFVDSQNMKVADSPQQVFVVHVNYL